MKRILLYFVIVFLLSTNLFAQNMQVVGSAIQLDSHCYRLTPTQMFQIGAMWNPTPISLSQDFEVEVLTNFDCFDADGADGVVFALQPIGTNVLGTTGEDMGYGFVSPSLGVEFDTYQDFNKDDPTFDHIAIVKNGDVAHWSNNTLVQPIQASVLSANIEDCNDHLLKIEWDAASHTISVYFDCVLRTTYSNDIASTIFGGSDLVYWGFTAATGGFFSNQDICFIDNTVSLPSQTICEGESTTITAPFGTGYSWSPTIGLSNPNVRTPTASPTTTTNYAVTVTSYCGNTATYQYTVHVNPKPEPIFSGITDFCSETGSTTISVQNNFVSYSWEGGGNTFSKQFGESNIASVTVTDSNGCTGSASATITEHFNPTPIIGGTTNFCSGFSTILSVENIYSSYTWNLGSNSATQSVSQAGTVSVVVADAFGCEGTASTNVVENSFLVPVISGETNFCEGGNTILSVQNGFNSYSWSTGGTMPSEYFDATNNTVTVTVTSSNGCSGTATVSVTEHATPQATISGNLNFCEGNNTTLSAPNGFVEYLWSLGNQNSSSIVVDETQSNVSLTVTDQFGCTAASAVDVTENPNPTINIGGSTSFCSGFSTTLSVPNTFNSYSWSLGSNSAVQEVAQATSVSVTVTDANGCSGSASANISATNFLQPSISGNTDFCEGSNTTLNIDGNFASYAWSSGSQTASQSFDASATGVTVTVTDANGCSGTATVSVTEHATPQATISGNLNFCEGNNTTLSAPNGFVEYLWSLGNQNSSSIVVDETQSNVSLTVTDQFGCTAASAVDVTENPNPTINIGGSTSFCSGFSTTLSVPNTFSSYSWSLGSNSAEQEVAQATSVSVTVTDANGCSGSASANISETNFLQPSISGNTDFCEGSNTTLNIDGNFASYAWSSGSQTASQNFDASATGVTVTVTDANGCSGTATVSVTEHPTPQAAISGNLSFCEGNNTTLSAPNGFVEYLWSLGNQNSSSIVVDETQSNVSLTVTDQFGCTATSAVDVTENPNPTINIGGSTSFCSGFSTTLSVPNTFNSYSWSLGSNSAVQEVAQATSVSVTVTDANGCSGSASANISATNFLQPSISGNTDFCEGSNTTLNIDGNFASYAWSSGSQTASQNFDASATGVTVTVTDANGCSGTATVSVTEHATPTPTITGSSVFCTGNSTTLNVAENYSNYVWSNGTATNAATFGASGVVSVTVTDVIGCVGNATITLSEQSYLTPSIVGDLAFCENSGTTLHIGESYADYLWSHGDNDATSYLSQAGTYTVTVSDDNGCTGSGMVTVVMNELPEVSIGGATLFNEGGSTLLFGNVGMTHYQWSTGDTTDNIHLTEGGVYSLLITDDNACTNQASVIVTKKLFYDLVIPNAFSPNDDDVNDVFKVRGYHIEDFTMRIHDRWGNTLFETQDPTVGWMGQRNKDGSYYEMGTYVYAIWVRFDNGKEQIYRGNLTLIR